ncbi:MAG: ornithine cyclodeaminase family protein [Chloroflexota bacterium]
MITSASPGKQMKTQGYVMPRTILLGRREIEELLGMDEVVKAVERAFILKAKGEAVMPPKIYLDLPKYHGDFRAMPAYVDGGAGMKWVGVYPENTTKYNLPTVIGLIVLSDPANSYPLAIMDGTLITGMRTGAAGGIAVKYLARKNSRVIGFVGAGRQARTQMMAIREVMPEIERVKVYDVRPDASRKYAEEMSTRLELDVSPVATVAEAADADVVVTVTLGTGPVVLKKHVKPGTHINAIGADARGKQELEGALVASAEVIVDDIEQASHSGEINVPVSKGEFKVRNISATLGEVAAGMKVGRKNDEEITIFDSTGLAIQDIVCAKLAYEKAKDREVTTFDFLS